MASFRRAWRLGVVVLGAATTAVANESGRVGYSGKAGVICNACHAGGTRPVVRLEGPLEVSAGATATFRFVVVSRDAAQDEAGFNVAASTGTLSVIVGQGTRLSGGELTHSEPRRVDAMDEASWMFNWRAPNTLGEQRLFGAGNSVNGNNATTGDRAADAVFDVLVVAASVSPTATPSPSATVTTGATVTMTASATATMTATATATMTADATATSMVTPSFTVSPTSSPSPPPTASATPSASATATATVTTSPTVSPTITVSPSVTATATATPTRCAGDCDGDDQVTVDELITGVNVALGLAAIDRCPPFDTDRDGGVSVAELVAAVDASLRGC